MSFSLLILPIELRAAKINKVCLSRNKHFIWCSRRRKTSKDDPSITKNVRKNKTKLSWLKIIPCLMLIFLQAQRNVIWLDVPMNKSFIMNIFLIGFISHKGVTYEPYLMSHPVSTISVAS